MNKFLRRPAVQTATGLSAKELSELIASGDFPKCVAWDVNDIYEWIASSLEKETKP